MSCLVSELVHIVIFIIDAYYKMPGDPINK
jgi:hypothetical protein